MPESPEPLQESCFHYLYLKDYSDVPNTPEPYHLRHFLSIKPIAQNTDPNSVSLIRETLIETSSIFAPSTA